MANSSGILSQWIELSYSATSSGTFTTLNDLQSVPDLGATPDKIDVTCLGDSAKRYINGIKDFGSLEFGFLYDATQYATLSGLTGTVYFKVSVKTSASDASPKVFSFSGEPSVKFNAAGINEALKYTLAIALQSDITVA